MFAIIFQQFSKQVFQNNRILSVTTPFSSGCKTNKTVLVLWKCNKLQKMYTVKRLNYASWTSAILGLLSAACEKVTGLCGVVKMCPYHAKNILLFFLNYLFFLIFKTLTGSFPTTTTGDFFSVI